MNTRLLWARIKVSFRTPFDKVTAYLQRSSPSPFDLYIDIDTDLGSGSDSQLDPDVHLYTSSEWETIMSYMTRCHRLFARCNKPQVVNDMINRLHIVNAPLLRSLQIEGSDGGIELHMGPYRKIIDSGAPALTAVRLVGLELDRCLPPLTGVTSLDLLQATWGMAWSDLRDILGGCLSLTHLVIGDIFAEDIPDNFESTIILPILRSLGISADDYDGAPHIEQILLAISAPLLESLIIEDIFEQDLVDISQLQNSDCFPCLRSVSLLTGGQIGRQSWTSFCSVFPRITHFTLGLGSYGYENVGAETLITALAYTPAESASPTLPLMLPELNTLSFIRISVRAAMLLCDLVPKWHAAGRPLRSLQFPRIIFCDGAFASSLDRLRALIEVKEYQSDGDQVEEGIWNWS